jgi:hypothetical protein
MQRKSGHNNRILQLEKSMPAIYWLHPANATADYFKLKLHPETWTYFHPGTTDAATQEVIKQYERDCTVDKRYVDVVGKSSHNQIGIHV